MKRTLVVLLILVAAVTLLSACGGAATPAPTTAPAAAPTTAPEPTKAPEPTMAPEPTEAPEATAAPAATGPTLVIWADNTRAPALQKIAPAFEEKYGVKLQIQELAFGDIRDNIKRAGPAGEGPDLFIGAHDWIGELYVNGILAPVDLAAKSKDFWPTALDLFTYDGKLVGLPYATENLALFYNPELVPTAPKTWDEVKTVAAQLQEDGKAKYGFCRMNGDPYHFYPIQTAFGGYIFGKNADGSWNTKDLGIGNEGSIAAAAWLDEMVKQGSIVGTMDWDTNHKVFETGDCAMLLSGPWALPRFRDAGAKFEIAPMPAGPAGPSQPFLGGQGFFLNAFGKNQLLAQAFLTEFMASEDAMRQLFEADPRPSAYLAVRDNPNDAAMAAFGEAGKDAQPMPTIPEMSAVWGPAGDALTLVQAGTSAPEAAMTNAQAQVETALTSQ